MPTIARMMRAAGAPGAAAVLVLLAGCTSVIYDSNPQAPVAAQDEEPDFASHTVQNLLATCIRWAVEQSPPPEGPDDGWFAVNLPPGVTREQYIEVAQRIGERAAPLTPELEYLPTYHIGWVWMRGDHARVDVFRPVFALSTGGETVYQAITLHLTRRWASWRVERTQPWEPGVVELPAPYYLPPEELPEGEAQVEVGAEAGEEQTTDAPGAEEPGPQEPSEEPGFEGEAPEESPAEGAQVEGGAEAEAGEVPTMDAPGAAEPEPQEPSEEPGFEGEAPAEAPTEGADEPEGGEPALG